MKPSSHRPTTAHIFLEHLSYNLEKITQDLPRGTKRFAVVKADAYGHGAVEVARELSAVIDGYCVSNMDEALELRQSGIEHPILVLGVVPWDCIPIAKQMNISLTIASLAWWKGAQQEKHEISGVAFHIKVDTGMGRLGFQSSQEIKQLLQELTAEGAVFEGIYTHFATADQEDDCQFQRQLSRFTAVLSELEQLPPMIHASNSAATLWHNDAIFTMVRLGNALYGLNPSGAELPLPYPLKPVLSLESELVHVKTVVPGECIGYGATYCCQETEVIGTLPIGYADGLTRSLQGYSVIVDGHFCEIVGRVSMDQVTIRLPKEYPLGTKVTLIGRNGGLEASVQRWAEYAGTIHYEVLCLLSTRINRHYH